MNAKKVIFVSVICIVSTVAVAGNPGKDSTKTTINSNVFARGLFMSRGQYELKVFNNLYTETFPTMGTRLRNSFFTSFMQLTIGSDRNWNYGFDVLYKSNVTQDFNNNPLRVFQFRNTFQEHPGFIFTEASHGLSHIGGRVRKVPFQSKRFTVQQAVYAPVGNTAGGGWIINTDLFYEKVIDRKYMIFGDLGFWWDTRYLPFPYLKVFAGTMIKQRLVPYTMFNLPYEIGGGIKYFILPKLEIEFLYTWWLPFEFTVQDRRPQTFNIGLRYTNFRNY